MPRRLLLELGDGLVAGEARAQWRLLAALWVASGLLAISAGLLHLRAVEHVESVLVVGAGSVVGGLLVFALSGQLTERMLGPVLVLGTTAVAAATLAGGEAGTAFAVFYTWVGAEAWYFLTPRHAIAYTAYAIVLSGVVSASVPGSDALAVWVLSSGSLVVIGTMTAALRFRSDRLIAELRAAAVSDELTTALNLRGFTTRLDEELARARRTPTELSVVMADIDAFKRLNDIFGHHAGDRALGTFVALARRELREIDVIGRLGGDEFVFALPGSGTEGAMAAVARLRDVLRDELRAPDGTYVTVSFGVATFPAHATSSELLRQAADQALYRAKTTGRDRAMSFTLDAAHA